MGIPCSSKNMFPSNIQGLPTWYQIRASAEGYLSRKDVIDVMVMFNDATAAKDIYRVRDGGVILYDDSTPLPAHLKRDGVQYIGVPANKLVAKLVPASPLRAKQRNMIYVGALAYLFGIDMEVIKAVLEDTFGKKPAVIESNLVCIDAGYQYIKETRLHAKHCSTASRSRTATKVKSLPRATRPLHSARSTAAPRSFAGIPSRHRVPSLKPWSITCPGCANPKTANETYAIVQAEDEIASAGMVVGAGWAGARAMTSTSGPGVSLMNETIGLAYYAEIPCVFFIIQRGGPSTGLPTRTQQADISLMYGASHGDTRHILLIPHDMNSCFDFARRSFDFADRFQTPVFVAMDLDLGMNFWSSDPLKFRKRTLRSTASD